MRLTCLPFGPVCSVTRVEPSICSANAFTSSTDLAMRTPPLSPAFASLNLPLPRPPAWICDLTAHTAPPSFFAASTASAAEKAGSPCATGTPNFARTCFAWYSWMFIRAPPLPSCPAKAGHPVLAVEHCRHDRPSRSSTGSPAFAGDDEGELPPQLRRDLVAGVDQRAHGRHRLVEHLALGAGELQLHHTLDAFRADHHRHPDVHVLHAVLAIEIGGAGDRAPLFLQ